MGEVVAMQRKINVAVSRFGRVFELEFKAGPTPGACAPAAALSVDGAFLAWCAITFHDPDDWEEVHTALSDEHRLLNPSDLGISDVTEDEMDFHFLAEAEEYVMGLLNEALASKLSDTAREPGVEPVESADDSLAMTPHDRGRRVVEIWHNHGKNEGQLSELMGIEIYDALQNMGLALGELLDGDPEIPRERCGEFVRAMTSEALDTWRAADRESD